MAKKKIIWLSYDLGLKGDYSNLYIVLDKHKARDCGPNLAVFEIDYPSKISSRPNDFIKSLQQEIEKNVDLKESDRIYVIWKEDNTGKVNGEFIFGNRKRPSWEGYYREGNSKEVVDSE